jgi:hypothetical protein
MATTRAPAALTSWTATPPTVPVAALTSTLIHSSGPPSAGSAISVGAIVVVA